MKVGDELISFEAGNNENDGKILAIHPDGSCGVALLRLSDNMKQMKLKSHPEIILDINKPDWLI